ncbi:MAG TPA: S8 family peptidase [Verrucomicrobiae bacterium]|nr:S8 family peptidase [Verrucomicrobiae bacterium]
MPHHPEDERHPHLPLVRVEENPPRRKRPGFGAPRPTRGERVSFGGVLLNKIDEIEAEARRAPAVQGFAPHLVFLVPLAAGASAAAVAEKLRDAGLTVVSIEPDQAVVVFQDDANLAEFRRALDQYMAGPRIISATGEQAKTTQWDVFEFIEADRMRSWSRADRIGARLAAEIGVNGERIDRVRIYTLDVELWHPGLAELARQKMAELQALVNQDRADRERFSDQFVGDLLAVARVGVSGAKLEQLLDASIVAETELPEQPVFDAVAASQVTPRDFPAPPAPPEDGPRVCILDSGIVSNHPLLAANVGGEEAVLTATNDPADTNGHGTHLGGLAVFGDIRACYSNGTFSSPVRLFSARVLNDQNRFDDDRLIHTQMEAAIDLFRRPPYECRVFNLSLGSPDVVLNGTNRRQTLWAEALDTLARKHKVLIVVSAGNNTNVHANTPADAEQILQNYPQYLFDAESGLSDPATAAIALTVGSLSQFAAPAIRVGVGADDFVRAVAGVDEPSPFTRTGFGINGAIKPDLVHYGGNLLFEGFGNQVRRIRTANPDAGTGVMSFSHEPLDRLFSFRVGTSQAAPPVARIGALIWNQLKPAVDGDLDPNLVRAVLANSASVPEAASNRIAAINDDEGILRVCGYGLPDAELALESGGRRVTLIAQGRITIDTLILYEVPVPDVLRNAPGKKRIIASLAFDPPVKRRRAEYLGVEMAMNLFRGKTPEEVVAAYRFVTREERRTAPGALAAPFQCDLLPKSRMVETSTLQRREWSFSRTDEKYGDTYYLMIQARRNWAPPEITAQDFGLAVTLTAAAPQLYNQIQQRVRARERVRRRA